MWCWPASLLRLLLMWGLLLQLMWLLPLLTLGRHSVLVPLGCI